MATDVSSLTCEDTSRLYGGDQHWKKPGSLRVPAGAKAAAELQARGKPLPDEEMARRLHEELNGPEGGPTAVSTRRQRKAPTFYKPQAGGYGGLHSVEFAQAQEGNADEAPRRAAKQEAKATPCSSDDMHHVPSEDEGAPAPLQPGRASTNLGAASTRRQPAKRAHSAVHDDSSEHSVEEEAERDRRQRLRADSRREEASPSKVSGQPSRPPSSKESPASGRKVYGLLRGTPVLDSASDLGGRMRVNDLELPKDDRARQGEANSSQPMTRSAAVEDGGPADRRPPLRTSRSLGEARSEEALTPRGSNGRMASEASGRMASEGSGRMLGMSGASSSHNSEQVDANEEGAEDNLGAAAAGPVKMPKIGKTPMVQHGKMWYRGRRLKETPHKVLLDIPGFGGQMGQPFWLSKDSARIWRGSYKGKDWRHLGDGAWEPKQQQASKKGRGRGHHMRAKAKAHRKTNHSADEHTEAEDEDDEEKEEEMLEAAPAESRPASSHSRLNAGRHSPPAKPAAADKAAAPHVSGEATQGSAKRTRQAQTLEEGTGTSPRAAKHVKREQIGAKAGEDDLEEADPAPGDAGGDTTHTPAGASLGGSIQEAHDEPAAEELGTRFSAADAKPRTRTPPASRFGASTRKAKRPEREGLSESPRASERAAQGTATSPRHDGQEAPLKQPLAGAGIEKLGAGGTAGASPAKPTGPEPATEPTTALEQEAVASTKLTAAQAPEKSQHGGETGTSNAKVPGAGLGALAQALVDSSTKTMGTGAKAEAAAPPQPAPKSARGRKRAAAQRLAAEARVRAMQEGGLSPSAGGSPHGDSPGVACEKKGSEEDTDSPQCVSEGWKGAFKKRHQQKLAEVEAEEEAAESEDELSEGAQEPEQPAPRPIRVIRAPVRADMERSDLAVPGQRVASRDADTGTPPTPARRAGRGRGGRWGSGGGRGRGRGLRPMPSANSNDSGGARTSKPAGRGRKGGRFGNRAATSSRVEPQDLLLTAFNGIVDALDSRSQGVPYQNGYAAAGAAPMESGAGFPACDRVLSVSPEVFAGAGYMASADVKEFRSVAPPLPIFQGQAQEWRNSS